MPLIGFPLTKKRFLSFPPKRRHRHLALWFERLFAALRKDPGVSRGNALSHYAEVLRWLEMPPPEVRGDFTQFLCDSFHLHLSLSGQAFREIDFAESINGSDRETDYEPKIAASVLLDNVRSGHNVGAVFRTADGAGWREVLRRGFTPGPESGAVAKVALGSHNWVPSRTVDDPAELKRDGAELVVLETGEGSESLYRRRWREPVILALGNEELGISKEVWELADARVKLPMLGNKHSLNVASSFAVAAYEINRALGKFR